MRLASWMLAALCAGLSCAGLWALPSRALGQASLLSGFGGPADFGTLEIVGDDADTIVDVTGAFPGGLPFYGTDFNNITVSANGLVSLGGPRTMAPRAPFPVADRAILAAWSYDMLPEGTGTVAGSQRAYVFVEPSRVIITWYLVPARGGNPSELVSAQMVLTSGSPTVTQMELRYARCDWTSVGSGTLHAQAGVNRGDAAPGEFIALPGSGTALIADLCTTSNMVPSEPGVWQLVLQGTSITATCGNGLRETGESCDDGNTVDGDGCSPTCGAAAVCGNNILEPPEECDDGDRNPRDGCDENCMLEVVEACGDGVAEMGEECDDGNFIGSDDCVACLFAACGDRFVWAGHEQCDDGNTTPGDGCDADCFVEVAPGVDGGPRPMADGGSTGHGYSFEGGGCTCRAVGSRPGPRPLVLLTSMLLALALATRRRR